MGPVNLVICCRQMLTFITTSMTILGEKLGGGPVDHSAGLRVVSGDFFLGSSRIRPTLLVACESLARTWTGVGSVRVVLIRFSPAGCTSI
jgi:hypothetical protein